MHFNEGHISSAPNLPSVCGSTTAARCCCLEEMMLNYPAVVLPLIIRPLIYGLMDFTLHSDASLVPASREEGLLMKEAKQILAKIL